jgi:subtilase family serine protease
MMRHAVLAVLTLLLLDAAGHAAPAKAPSLSPRRHEAVDLGRAPASERHKVVVALDLRNRDTLEAFLADVQDPASPRYQQFLSQAEFNALYAPAPEAEQAVVDHLRRGGLRIGQRFANRLLVVASGSVAALERTFGVEIHRVRLAGQRHYTAIDEPSLPADVAAAVVGVIGLDDLNERRPLVRDAEPTLAPQAALGANCCHLGPADLFTFYSGNATYTGAGQTIVIAGAYAWRDTDNTTFSTQWGLPQLPAGSAQVCTGASTAPACNFSTQNSLEIALDVEYAHATAPGARILNYMAASTSLADFTVMYNRIVTDDPAHVVSTSWGACEAAVPAATQQADDAIFANANAIGQAWFAASGDSGSRDCSGLLTVDNPANSPHVVGVGGTTPTCSAPMTSGSPACAGYGSETGWSGSGGGVSNLFARPAYQTGCGIAAGAARLVPDVALESNTSPGNYVVKGGLWYVVGGTSGAAPQWAGLAAQLTQKRGAALGHPGALLYALCGTNALHDVTAGSNGDYTAGPGHDLVTGIGSFHATNLLALAGGNDTTTTTTPPTTSTSSTVPTTTSTIATTTTSTTTPSTTTTSTTTTTTPATTSTTTTAAPTTTTTTLAPVCLPVDASCVRAPDCCSKVCKGKGGAKVCQ